jgi:hypothetical protein
LGPDHQSTRSTAANLATNYKNAGRYGDSLPYYELAHEVSSRLAHLRGYTADLLEVHLRLGHKAEAEPLFAEVVTQLRATAPAGSEKLASGLTRNGQLWLEFGAAAKAEPLLAESWEIRERIQPDKWTTFAARSSFGAALLARDAFAEAEPHLTTSAAGLLERAADIPAAGLPRLDDALRLTVELYTRWNAATPAPELGAKLAEWQARQKKYEAK